MTKGIAYHNSPPTEGDVPENAPPEYVKAEFAKRLYHRMVQRGWNQSDLARQAALHTPDKKFGRDNVSNYIRGKSFPRGDHLRALCLALNVSPEELVPPRTTPSAGDATPPLDARDMGDGTVFIRLNKRLPWEKALKILNIAQGEE